MNETLANAIFIEYITKPDFDRLHFLIEKEKESKRPPEVFAQYLMGSWQFYYNELINKFQEFKSWGNDPLDWVISLNIYSGGQIIFISLYLSKMPYYWEGINEYINERCSKKKEPKKPNQPSNRERQAMYNFYMGTYPKKGEDLYKETLNWEKDHIRLHSNASRKSLNSKKGHMEAVRERVLSEKKQGWKKVSDRIGQDISTLLENFNKRVPE